MNDINAILDVIDARAAHYCSCAYTTQNDEDWAEDRPLYLAQYYALSAVTAEIRRSVNTERDEARSCRSTEISERWVFVTEMGGELNATMFNTIAEAEQAQDRFCRDFRMECTFESHAACDIECVSLPPLPVERSSGLDARFACIMQVEGRMKASIHDTREEAEAAEDAAREWYGNDGMYGSQAILIPRFA
jgi:hypothetical protein